MNRTSIHDAHVELRAEMKESDGWEVPARFGSISDEHHAVRFAAGLFDIGYLGRIEISGPDAPALLQNVFTRNVEKLQERSSIYGLLCTEAGTILCDAVLFRFESPGGDVQHRFLLTVAPNTTDKVVAWLSRHGAKHATITDQTMTTGHLSLQGPASTALLEKLTAPHFKKIRKRAVRKFKIADETVHIARLETAGEDGYELILPAANARALWDLILQTGKEDGVLPCGAESRDVLRIEMGRPLYGYDMDETRTPDEAGLMGIVCLSKDFIGKTSLMAARDAGAKERLIGFVLGERLAPRPGGSIFSESREIGIITSGALSPSLRVGIGLGYVLDRYIQAGQEVDVESLDREVSAKIVDRPLYQK